MHKPVQHDIKKGKPPRKKSLGFPLEEYEKLDSGRCDKNVHLFHYLAAMTIVSFLFYAFREHQPRTITRIVSGCRMKGRNT